MSSPPAGGRFLSTPVVPGFSRTVPGAADLLAVLVVVLAIFARAFLTVPNVLNVGVQSSVLLLLALPMTLIIMTEGIDLSMGAVLSLCGVVMAMLLMNEKGLAAGLAAAVGAGLAFGVANGVLVVW